MREKIKMNTTTQINTVEKLTQFVNQRSGMNFADYGDVKSYRCEAREITNDRKDYYELLALASQRLGTELAGKLENDLKDSNGRLIMNANGELEYCTGQYFATEYRPAACRILRDLIWADYRDEKNSTGEHTYKDGTNIRTAIKRNVSRRVAKNYFN